MTDEHEQEAESMAGEDWGGLPVQPDGRVIVEVDSILENTLLIIAYIGFVIAAISLIFVLDSGWKTGVNWLVNGLLLMLGGGILRWRTDDHYFIDPDRRIIGLHHSFRGSGGEEDFARFDQLLSTGVDGIHVRVKGILRDQTVWKYRPVLALKTGTILLLNRRYGDFESAKQRAETVAAQLEISCVKPRKETTLTMRPGKKKGDYRLTYGSGLLDAFYDDETTMALVFLIVHVVLVILGAVIF